MTERVDKGNQLRCKIRDGRIRTTLTCLIQGSLRSLRTPVGRRGTCGSSRTGLVSISRIGLVTAGGTRLRGLGRKGKLRIRYQLHSNELIKSILVWLRQTGTYRPQLSSFALARMF
jgi:hypothetical protein